MQQDEYICGLSGITPIASEYVEGNDELEDLPIGWTKITIQTRVANPRYQLLQTTKEAMRQQAESAIQEESTDEEKAIAKASIALQVDAHYAAIAAEIPPFLIEESVTYVSDVESNEELKSEWEKWLKTVDLTE